jgi:hypothetical protein
MTKVREVTKEEEDWFKDNLRYDPETGDLWWTKRGLGRKFDRTVGRLHERGYKKLHHKHLNSFRGYYAHRIAWFLYYGVWPKNQIDHINNIRDDNRIFNLREATQSENSGNMKKSNNCTSMYKGVTWDKKRGLWRSRVMLDSKSNNLGWHSTEEEAALAYNKAALEYFGEFAKINVIEPLDTGMTNTYISSSSGELTC